MGPTGRKHLVEVDLTILVLKLERKKILTRLSTYIYNEMLSNYSISNIELGVVLKT